MNRRNDSSACFGQFIQKTD